MGTHPIFESDFDCLTEMTVEDAEVNDTLLELYYKEYFPLEPFVRWLGYGEIQTLARREFSFTLEGDIYKRFLDFSKAEDLQRALVKDKPHKIDIGAVYTNSCKHRLSAGFKEVQRELVFDIDISDYDDVRRCCQGAKVCSDCWPLMSIAVKILERTLNRDFGYDKLLFVFSGRRGIHCWVLDEKARFLDKTARVALANYCQITVNSSAQIHSSFALHPMENAALQIIDRYWDELLKTQDFLSDEAGVDRMLKEVKIDDAKKATWKSEMMRQDRTLDRWAVLELHAKKDKDQKRDRNFIQRIKLSYTYPRIDIKVTEGFNHLLKAPFSIHPKTGKICVPFSAEEVDSFDLGSVPTVFALKRKHKTLKDEMMDGDCSKLYRRGAMAPSVAIFENLLDRVGKEVAKSNWKKK